MVPRLLKYSLQCGKTQIANFISESIEESGTPRPTQGVRIVEFELSSLNINGKNTNVDIELWDCSGDHKYVCNHFLFV